MVDPRIQQPVLAGMGCASIEEQLCGTHPMLLRLMEGWKLCPLWFAAPSSAEASNEPLTIAETKGQLQVVFGFQDH